MSAKPAGSNRHPRRLRFTLSRKLVTAFSLFGLFPVAVLGAIGFAAIGNINAAQSGALHSAAGDIAERIDRNMFERYGDVQAFARNTVVASGDRDAIVAVMNEYVALYGVYSLTMLVDPSGNVLAVNNRDASGKTVATDGMYGKNYKQTPWFEAVAAGRFTTSRPNAAPGNDKATGTFIGDASYNDDVRAAYGGQASLSVSFAAPVQSQGQLVGYWVNYAQFDLVHEIVERSFHELKELDFSTSIVSIVDAQGRVLAQTESVDGSPPRTRDDDALILETDLAAAGVEAAKLALSGDDGYTEEVDPQSHVDAVIGYHPLEGAMGFPGMGWSVLVRVPQSQAHAIGTMLFREIIAAAIAAFLLIGLAGFLVARTLSRPIGVMAGAAGQIAEGRLDVVVDIDSSDEIGSLADGFRSMVGRLNDVFGRVRAGANQVAGYSRQISSASRDLADSATTSAASLQQIRASMTEISRQTEETTKSVEHALSLASRTREAADTGDHQMRQMVHAMTEIDASAQEISKVIKIIDDIAFQINLLSLNAAVEAARAGEHGRGFAVVAEEVRNLATRSAKAARETGALIETAIQKATRGTEIAEDTARGLTAIVDGIQQISTLTDQVVSATREQSRAIVEMNQGISQVDEVTQNNTASAEELAAAATELSGNANKFQALLQHFVLARGDSRGDHDHFEPDDHHSSAERAFEQHHSSDPSDPGRDTHGGHSGWLHREALALSDSEFGRY
jgi:methyl-accepting chemotaxis protein